MASSTSVICCMKEGGGRVDGSVFLQGMCESFLLSVGRNEYQIISNPMPNFPRFRIIY